MARRLALVVVALAAVAVFASGAFGFTGVTAERGVSVAVVDDESAFLGLPNDPDTVECEVTGDEGGCTVDLVDVTNRFATDLTDVSVTSSNDAVDPAAPHRIGVGETATVEASVTCDPAPGESTTVRTDLDVTVAGDGVEATKYDKSVAVTCIGPSEPSVEFHSCESVATEQTVATLVYYQPGNGPNAGYNDDESGQLVGVVLGDGRTFANGNAFDEGEDGGLEIRGNCGGQNGERGEAIEVAGKPPWAGELDTEESEDASGDETDEN